MAFMSQPEVSEFSGISASHPDVGKLIEMGFPIFHGFQTSLHLMPKASERVNEKVHNLLLKEGKKFVFLVLN